MKLSALNAAIRKAKEVRIWFRVPGSKTPIYVLVRKDSLLESLRVAYDGDLKAETGLHIRAEDGLLMSDDPAFAPPDPALDGQWSEQYDAQAALSDEDDPFGDPLADEPATDDLADLFG